MKIKQGIISKGIRQKEYVQLRYLQGEAQCDLGNCTFVENGIEYKGCYIVLSFPYSNIAFCQLLKSKNVHCILQGLKNIFEYIDDYNRDLFDKCTALHDRKHHKTKTNILELFECDKQAYLQLPLLSFEVATYIKRKVDRQGIVRFKGQHLYYLEPKYANKSVQVKITYNKVYFYDMELNIMAEFDRLYSNKNYVAIHWEDWLSTVARKPNSLFYSGLADMFTERLKNYLLNGTSKLRSIYMRALNELTEIMPLECALIIEDKAAKNSLVEIEDILALATQ